MNANRDRHLLVVGLERLLNAESKMAEDYGTLSEMLDGTPAGLLLDWVVIEEEAHHTLLVNILRCLKHAGQKAEAVAADKMEMERETLLCWIKRLQTKEQKVIADCLALKSQASRETAETVDAYLDAVVMDSEKHQRFLLATATAIENIIIRRPH